MKISQRHLAKLISQIPLFSLLLAVLAGAGCKTVQTATFTPGPARIEKHPMRVALVATKELCQLEQRRDPEGYVYQVGAYLCPCVRHIANGAFAKTTEFDSVEAATKSADIDALLIPHFVKLEIRARGVAWEKRHTLVVMEWTLKDKTGQKTLWLATTEGRAEGKVGTGFSMDKRDRLGFQQAMDDLCQKSIEAFNQSEELKTFANKLARQ